MKRQTFFQFLSLLFVCLNGLNAENLLKEDPFYQTELPKILGENFKPKGTYRLPYFVKPNNFHPFSNDPFVSSLWSLCCGTLSNLQLGHYQTMAPGLAKQIEKIETEAGTDYLVELRENLYWNPLDPSLLGLKTLPSHFLKEKRVVPDDFKLYIDVLKNPYVELPAAVDMRVFYKNLESIEIVDERHFIVHWKGPCQFDQDKLMGQLRPLPAHIFLYGIDGEPFSDNGERETSQLMLAKHVESHWAQKTIISCGPWILDQVTPDQIELVQNKKYPIPHQALFEKMHFVLKASPNSAWQAFKLDKLDSFYLTPMQWKDFQSFKETNLYQKQSQAGNTIEKLEFLAKMYYFIAWNQKNPLFQDQRVRQALTHAIDRNQIIEHFLKGFAHPLTGPFMPGGFSYDEKLPQLQADSLLAAKLLEEAGYFLEEPMGIRLHKQTKKPLRFKLSYFLRNELTQSICQYISTALREVGVDCILDGVDYSRFMEHYQTKSFDALYMAWALGTPPEDPAQTWSSSEADKAGSSNLVGFKNEQVDELILKLKTCDQLPLRKDYYHQIHNIVAHEQPYTFLYVPQHIFLYRSRLGNVFIPKKRSDLVCAADIEEPCPRIFYMKEQ